MLRFRILKGEGISYRRVPQGVKKARSGLDALRDFRPSDGYWLVMCEDGTYVEYEVRDGGFIRVRGKDPEPEKVV